MKNMKNKIFILLICLITLLSNFSITTFASSNKSDFKNLLDKGFSLNQIKNMPSSQFEKLNRSGYTNVSKKDNYYRISYNKDTHKKLHKYLLNKTIYHNIQKI